jgi:flagellar hook-associated protein 3 FlgL
MRVTNQMIFEAGKQQTAAARDKVLDAQQKVTTGQRVVHPGDDPAAAGVIVSHTIAVQRFETIDKAISAATEESQVADGALQSLSTLLASARALAVQFGNDSYSATERAGGAQEIQDIFGQATQLMNTQVAGRFIFGGNVDRTQPFDNLGNYTGDAAVRQVEVAPGLLQNQSIRADQMMKGVGGGVDVFATLTTLATALTNNDGAGIRNILGDLVTSGDQVATALTQNGGVLDGLQSAQNIGDVAKTSAKTALAAVSEVDIFDAASELAKAQQSLEASLSVTAKSFSLSLLDFLPHA